MSNSKQHLQHTYMHANHIWIYVNKDLIGFLHAFLRAWCQLPNLQP